MHFGVHKLLLFSVLETWMVYGDTFEFPKTYSNIASYSTISATSTCSNGGTYNCNTSCPHRDAFPSSTAPLKNLTGNCIKTIDNPSNTGPVQGNGTVKFTSTTNNCSIENIVTASSSKFYFTFSVWVKLTCNGNCEIFSIDETVVEFRRNNNRLYFGSQTFSSTFFEQRWALVVLKYDGTMLWYINNVKQLNVSLTGKSTHTLKLGPSSNLNGSDTIQMVDARWYTDALTNREIDYLYTGILKDVKLKSECRCPVTHPTLVQYTLPVEYMNCTNGNEQVLRLGEDMHLQEYMTDNNDATSWISERGYSVNVTLDFKNQFQIKQITIQGINNKPSSLQVVLFKDTKENTVLNFKKSCSGSTSHCDSLNDHLSGKSFSFDFEKNKEPKRSEYEDMIADKITVNASYTPANYFTVSELKVEARCNCFGQNSSCSISKGNFACTCDQSSHTSGSHCDMCVDQYFRLTDDFKCAHACNCNTTGSSNTVCEKVDGQCSCKTNVEGRQCSQCMHNTDNFGKTGCTKCPCFSNGITDCSGNLRCNCKENVENNTGRCTACLPNYYGITKSSGCTFCNCDTSGTNDTEPNCDDTTGKCYCRANVQGMKCNTCKDEYYGLAADKTLGCDDCLCNIVGSKSLTCDKVTGQCPCVDGQGHIEEGNRQCIPGELKLQPKHGPIAGGTHLTLTGTLLGDNAKVTLTLDGTEQVVESRNQSFIIFRTLLSPSTGKRTVSLKWTYKGITYSDDKFENETKSFDYMKNSQLIVPTENIKTFASGGCTFSMRGSDVDSVAYPKMLVYDIDGHTKESSCTSEPQLLKCATPNLDNTDTNSSFQYGFRMDGIEEFRNASTKYGSMLIVVPDPVIYDGMSETFRNTFDNIFTIKGKRLHEACHDADVKITLGDKNCALLSRTNDSITCDPGQSFPGTARTVQVKVKIGNLEVIWGELKINSFWTNTEFIYIACGAGVFLILVIVIVICIAKRRNSNSYNKDKPDDSIPLEIQSNSLRNTKSNNYTSFNPVAVIQPQKSDEDERTTKEIEDQFCKRLKSNVGKIVKVSLIERCNIDPGKLCTHKGKKIRVLNGQYNASTSSPYSGSSLTIKTLVSSYPEQGDLPDWLNDGLLECTRLQDFDNDNVLRMKGIAVDAKNIYIIYPEMANKTLKDCLLQGQTQPLSAERKLEFCIQVAEGMNYLSSQNIVHKDLAARNCWVSRDYEVKIGDASFSYDLYPGDYYENNGRYQAVRWMAPESLRQGFYDTKSDIWAYGVVIWEVFTDGFMPYFDIKNNDEVRRKVCDEQYRLGKPHDCSDAVFNIIEQCHKTRSEERPNFFIVQNLFDTIINPPPALPLYANQDGLAAAEADMEDYQNIQINPLPRPPRVRKH